METTSRKVLITGASGGIGRAIAERFAAAGDSLILQAFTNSQALQELQSAYPKAKIHVLTCDLTDPAAQDDLAEQAWNWERPGLDVLIQAAGVDILTGERKTWTFDQKLEALWKVDVQAGIRLARTLGMRMKATAEANGASASRPPESSSAVPHGVILNIGWDAVSFGMAGDSALLFAAAKGAVTAFSRSLAATLAPFVRVNVLAPGFVQTRWGEEAPPAWQNRVKQASLLDRWGNPQDVANAAFFLASPEADFLNDVVLPVNGGMKRQS